MLIGGRWHKESIGSVSINCSLKDAASYSRINKILISRNIYLTKILPSRNVPSSLATRNSTPCFFFTYSRSTYPSKNVITKLNAAAKPASFAAAQGKKRNLAWNPGEKLQNCKKKRRRETPELNRKIQNCLNLSHVTPTKEQECHNKGSILR